MVHVGKTCIIDQINVQTNSVLRLKSQENEWEGADRRETITVYQV